MKERPIIFNADMVRAILDRRKTQTRRPIKDQPDEVRYWQPCLDMDLGWYGHHEGDGWQLLKCPYGQPGDRLWVRETFWAKHCTEFSEWHGASIDHGPCLDVGEKFHPGIQYCATPEDLKNRDKAGDFFPVDWNEDGPINDGQYEFLEWDKYSKHSSIHMPRWASRVTLEIKSVRVKRVLAFSRGDAMAEGCPFPNINGEEVGKTDPIGWFRGLWNSIYGKTEYAWEKNPWVWVIEFERLTQC